MKQKTGDENELIKYIINVNNANSRVDPELETVPFSTAPAEC